jgi:hypothetical protein
MVGGKVSLGMAGNPVAAAAEVKIKNVLDEMGCWKWLSVVEGSSATAHKIHPRLGSSIPRNVIFFFDREGDDRAVVFGESAFNEERERLVAGDGAGELCRDDSLRGFDDGSAGHAVVGFMLPALNAHGHPLSLQR